MNIVMFITSQAPLSTESGCTESVAKVLNLALCLSGTDWSAICSHFPACCRDGNSGQSEGVIWHMNMVTSVMSVRMTRFTTA